MSLRPALVLALAAALGLALGRSSPAQVPEQVTVRVGQAAVVTLERRPQRVAVEDSDIASLEVLPEGGLRIVGLRIGETRILGRYDAQLPIIIRVKVVPGASPTSPTAP